MEKTLTFTKLSKSGNYAIYQGLRTKIRIAKTVFPDSKPVESFTVSGEFAGPREKKPQMTAEERKIARQNAPKLTLAQKIEKQQKRLQKLQEAAAKEGVEVPQASPEAQQAVGSF